MKRIIAIISAFVIIIASVSVSSESYYSVSDFDEKSYELTGNPRDDIVGIAMTQIGYHEGNSESEKNGLNSKGQNNYIKYSEYSGFDAAWCAMFIVWCARKAGIDGSSGINDQTTCAAVSANRNCFSVEKKSPLEYTPMKGDLIFFDSNIDKDDWTGAFSELAHVGIVVHVSNNRVFTVEGNTGDRVMRKVYPLNHSRIVGYGIPNYQSDNLISGEYGKYLVTAVASNKLGSAEIHELPIKDSNTLGAVSEKQTVTGIAQRGEYIFVVPDYGTPGWVLQNDLYFMKSNKMNFFQKIAQIALQKGNINR